MSAQNVADLYQFEAFFEAAFKAMLEASELKVVIPGNLKFQQARPRVEIELQSVAETGDNYDQKPIVSEWRNVGFRGQLSLDCISNAGTGDDGNIGLHRAYVAKVREVMAAAYANGSVIDAHEFYTVNRLTCTGTTPTSKPEEGYFMTTLIFEMNWVIRPEAWPQQ